MKKDKAEKAKRTDWSDEKIVKVLNALIAGKVTREVAAKAIGTSPSYVYDQAYRLRKRQEGLKGKKKVKPAKPDKPDKS